MIQNMPAAGGMVAANYVYGVAKPDGLTIASINPAHYFNQLQGNKEVQFDWTKFTWLASSDKSEHMLYMRTDAPYKIDTGCPQSKRSAEMRRHRNRNQRPLHPAHAGRGAGHQVYNCNGLRRR